MPRLSGVRRLLDNALTIRDRHGIGLRTQWRSFREFHQLFGINRAEFYGYWLWDTNRPMTDRLAFISNVERRAIEYRMNPVEPSCQIRNKAWATARLTEAGIPVGEVLALLSVHPQVVPTDPAYPFLDSTDAVRSFLAAAPSDGLVIKPDDGEMGRSVHVFREAGPAQLVGFDGTEWSVPRFLELLGSESLWKVERRVHQHPALATVAGETLGTMRLLTYRMLDGTIHLGPAIWKVPIGLSGLDHFSHGAGQLAAQIDPATGRVGPARRWFGLGHVDDHPLTGQRITDTVIPHWSAVQDVARRSAECFPDLASLSYDIGVTSDGPVVIEASACWGERATQAAGPTGLVQGTFLQFLEERGFGDVINLAARDTEARLA